MSCSAISPSGKNLFRNGTLLSDRYPPHMVKRDFADSFLLLDFAILLDH